MPEHGDSGLRNRWESLKAAISGRFQPSLMVEKSGKKVFSPCHMKLFMKNEIFSFNSKWFRISSINSMTLCWSHQVKARGEELMAISETIKILNNARKPCDRGGVFSKIGGLCSPKDDALESFKKALPEKTSFLQVGQAQSQPVGEWITWSVETVRWTPRWASRPTNCCNCWIFQEQRHGLLDRKLDENNAKAWWFFKEWKLVFPTTTTWKDGRNTHSKVVYENNYYWRAAYEISPRDISDIQERVRRSLRKAVAFWQSCISSFGAS